MESARTVRDTRQKRAIRDVIEHADRPLSPDEVLDAARRRSRGLGIATVYRSLKALLDEEWIAAVDVPGRPVLYERSGKSHHHHFVCEACERVYELGGDCDMPASLPRGFRARHHDVTVYGSCGSCQAAR